MAERGPAALPLPQLRDQVQETRQANALLRTEVEMLEKWHRKLELSASPLQLPPNAPPELAQPRGRHRSRLCSAPDSFMSLSLCELAERELTEVKDEIRRAKEEAEQTLRNIKAEMEAADLWRARTQKAITRFEKDIVSAISTPEGSIVASETLLRYMEEKNRQRDRMRDKLCLENHLLKDYKKKLQQQLRQKEQVEEKLHEVHLQQLQVRNAQYQKQIDEKNQELLQLKLTSEKADRVLNSCKGRLQSAMKTAASLKKDISQRKKLLEKMEREAALVEEQRAKAEAVNQWLRKLLSDNAAPSVMSYMQKKMAVTDLRKSLKAWERKVAVAEMSLQSYSRAQKWVEMSRNQLA